jgi:hypothetical protein
MAGPHDREDDYEDDRDYDERGRGGRDVRRGANIPNYLTQAILCTLFCCVPFGIVAIINAAQVSSKLGAGDYRGAQRASDQARKWCWISLLVGLVVGPIIVFLQIMAQQKGPQFR